MRNRRKIKLMKLVGSIRILSILPIWATAAIVTGILMAVPVGRGIFEGLPYNVSYASLVGDMGLMISVLIAATIIQRGGIYIPRFLQSGTIHFLILLATFALGVIICVLTLSSRQGQVMDIYHDVILSPLFLYLAITLVPIVYRNGTRVEKRAVFGFFLLLLLLAGFDIKFDRMNQRQWLQNHDVTFSSNAPR